MTVGVAATVSESELTLWLRKLGLSTFVAIDLETTGLDPGKDRIIEVGAVRFVNGKAAASLHSLVRQDKPLDSYIADLTGITDEELRRGPLFSEIAGDLLNFVGDLPLIGQSTDFHFAFLRAAGQQLADGGIRNPFLFSHAPVLDTALVARVFWPELPSFSLPALAAHFDIPVAQTHRAQDDAFTAGTLLNEMIGRLPSRVWRELVRDLHRLIGSTSHRSRSFFAALRNVAEDIPKPSPLLNSDYHSEKREVIEEDLEELLGEQGRFEQSLSFFEARPMQIAMAQAVEQSFEKDEILLVEAPTGVGKSLAYLVPALRWTLAAPEDGRQVIVSSHTKMLQEQLHRKDIGEIRIAVEKPFRAAVLKGRNNYLCKRRLKVLLREAGERLSELDRIHLMPLLRWAELTATGDITEIGAFNPRTHSLLWSQVCSDAHACAGGVCSSAKGDFHRLAQERASTAQLVFVNHALLFSDLPRLTAGPRDKQRFVLDEAHQIEKAAVSAMTIELSPVVYRNALATLVDERGPRGLLPSLLRTHGRALTDDTQKFAGDLAERARALYASVRQHFSLLGERLLSNQEEATRAPKIRFRTGDIWHRDISKTLSPFQIQWLELTGSFNQLINLLADLRGDERLSPELLSEFRSSADKIYKLSEQLDQMLNDKNSNLVKWIEAGQTDYGAWCGIFMAPVSVGASMQEAFWSSIGSALLTSATLSASGDFSLVKSSLGLANVEEHEVRDLTVESPFAMERQMRMIVPMFLSDPRGNDGQFVKELIELVASVIESNRRATVILCTSNDTVERLTAALSPVAKRVGRPFFSQSKSSSTPELLAEYRKHSDGILIGAATFWEGIDLVGESLEILVVSKIPFDVPTDPWVAARCESLQEEGHDSFTEFSVPVATLRLKQGIGRLIRHPKDRGVAILADPRLFTARYGHMIRQALPGTVNMSHSREDLLKHISNFFAT